MKTYLFDFDGTLVDSMPTYVSTMLRILDENRIKYDSSIVKIITPLGLIGTAKYYIELGVNKTVEEIVAKMLEYMIEAYSTRVPAKNNVESTLKKLKEQGCDLHVLTASPHETLDPCLKRLGIDELFTNIWSCNDFGTTKADPNIYIEAAKRIGKDVSEIIFIDDNINADITAKSAGMTVYGIYDESSADYVDEMKKACEKYIYDFSELLEI
ncbi:MAG: HAD family hydrolase [Clostridia bacterium]|nr:HAD family hydrolase [Clostridia bacterium]